AESATLSNPRAATYPPLRVRQLLRRRSPPTGACAVVRLPQSERWRQAFREPAGPRSEARDSAYTRLPPHAACLPGVSGPPRPRRRSPPPWLHRAACRWQRHDSNPVLRWFASAAPLTYPPKVNTPAACVSRAAELPASLPGATI